jgi:hypothetical protein
MKKKPHLSPATDEKRFQGPVRIGDEIDRVAKIIEKYCELPQSSYALLIACWIVNTYTYRYFRYCGYLALRSATPRCGKSRLLRLIGWLSKGQPKCMTFPTAAVLFRCAGSEVLLLDEVDTLRNQDDMQAAVIQILNLGFEADGGGQAL